ncbi:MAG TPA: SDR family NAD(P)-dependent oxidoreductase [Fimbriimonas sp.]
MPDLSELVQVSRRYGGDRDFVIAGGGNTSLKEGGRMWVKASGHALATIDEDGFVEMDLSALQSLVHEDYGTDANRREELFKAAIYAARLHPEKGQRPSVECAVHALFPHRYVVHTHATYANMVSCRVDGEAFAKKVWGDEVLWVPYVDPGFTLAQEIAKRIQGRDPAKPLAMVWQNHGFVVAAQTVEEIDAVTERVLDRIKALLHHEGTKDARTHDRLRETSCSPSLRGSLARRGYPSIVSLQDSATVMRFVNHPDAPRLTAQGPLIPDQIVYCKSFPLWLSPEDDIDQALTKHEHETGFLPKVVLVPGLGMLAIGPSAKDSQDVAEMYEDAVRVMLGAEALGGVSPMSRRDREFIDAWEVEQYRRAVASKRGDGRLSGKVAVVTGGAQGFGRGISEALAKEGAHVVLADVNSALAREVADELCVRFGSRRAMGVEVDVADSASLKEMVEKVVAAYGGIDLYVSNAGVLRAGSVKTQDPNDFDLVTKVNYQGYFYGVQAVAPVMATQNQTNPAGWCDIVQINSKSGLQGSNRNGAYSGSKFGGIGLTQSFALELVEDRIKVNVICPGNFFEGPLWSDPENGLFVQYLREGKVPGAQTIEDVKHFYEAKVPMGRGCRVEDVVKALLYLVEQEYETGQALPVTGGQVMLS